MNQQDVISTPVCIPNINTAERRKRLIAGLVQLAVTLLALAALVLLGFSHWWRLALFPLYWGSAVGFFQWRDHT
ncbi:MAG TPA: hypothetical protein VMT46_12725 [Anaerolineaceae bacterium]|nr:hypothetical protein [Anaerolineaceae bacterium]